MTDNASRDSDLREKLRLLEEKFAARLPEKLAELDSALQQCRQGSPDQQVLVTLYHLLHTMAGSAGTFGFGLLGRGANALEMQFKALSVAESRTEEKLMQACDNLAEFLHWTMLDPKGGSTAVPKPVAAPVAPSPAPAPTPVVVTDSRLVYLVDDDAVAQQHIASQLESFGYEVVVMIALDGLADAIVTRAPSAIIIDIGFLQRGQYGAADIVRMQQLPMQSIPVIFTSNNAGFVSRLAAIRAGARGYFVKPVDVVALIDRLDVVTTRDKKQPCRILIVDDDTGGSEFHASVLRSAGMEVRLLHEPSDILQVLAEFRPELVVMDVYMPGCNGVELTKMLRQDSLLLDIPIVFLSTEANLDRQLEAIQAGADDFLTKPISSEHLLSSLTSRIERYRLLRDLIVRDGLTGLYKHSTLKEHLAREFARAKRSHTPLAVAMIDLDFFKNVNDHYGHPAGDQVLRTLSRLLQQRLRRVDIIGRYGGEEFSVIFPDTEVKAAVAVLERVREAFSKIRHHADTGVFTVTFSAGVVGLDHQPDPQALLGAADAQLYEAKGKGRNRVEYAV